MPETLDRFPSHGLSLKHIQLLSQLYLPSNVLTSAGLAHFAAALKGGALPAFAPSGMLEPRHKEALT